MRDSVLVERMVWGSLATIAVFWFLTSLCCATFDSDITISQYEWDFHFAGLVLPWSAVVVGFSMREHRPAIARRFALVALGASILLATGALVHFTWIRSTLGRALAAMDRGALVAAVESMSWLQVALAVDGPFLALAAWWLLRWMESTAARPHRRVGSLARTR